MSRAISAETTKSARRGPGALTLGTSFTVLFAIAFSHLINDMLQSLLPALYPLLKTRYALDFSQIGVLTLAFQTTASLLQPAIGYGTDRHPRPHSLAVAMGCSLTGLLMLSRAGSFAMLVTSACLIGLGSAIFHPESSRVARLASGGRFGMAQSVFQVGGYAGTAIGPLLAAFIVVPRGQASVAWFTLAALLGMAILWRLGRWYAQRLQLGGSRAGITVSPHGLSRARVTLAIAVLLMLIFSKYFYLASITTYYTFYLIHRFDLSIAQSQIVLFVFLGSVAVGTLVGGPLGDRFGRKYVIWGSILGVLPFTLMLPHANLRWTIMLSIVIGTILSSAFSAIIVYAQEMLPGRVGTVSGLFFVFAFGMGGLGAAVLGSIADHRGITYVYHLCAWLPAIGLLTAFLPDLRRLAEARVV